MEDVHYMGLWSGTTTYGAGFEAIMRTRSARHGTRAFVVAFGRQ